MSLPGTEAVRIIQRGARKAKGSADLLGAESAGLQGKILEAVERRGRVLQELARHYLPKLDDQTVGAAFAEIRGELKMLQLRRKVRIDELRAAIDASSTLRQQHEAALDRVNDELELKVAERTALEGKVGERLAADPDRKSVV